MHTLKKCTDNPIPQLPHDTPFSINQTRQRKKNTTDQGGRYTIGKHRHRNTGHRPRTMTAAAHSDIRNPTHKIHINLAAAALERTLLHHHHRHKKTSLIQKHSITRTPRNVLGRMRSDGCAHLQIDRVREEHDRAERAGDREARRNRTDARSGRGALGSIADDDAQSPDRASASLEAGRGEHETLTRTPTPRPRGREGNGRAREEAEQCLCLDETESRVMITAPASYAAQTQLTVPPDFPRERGAMVLPCCPGGRRQGRPGRGRAGG